jgi:hypothetical protein
MRNYAAAEPITRVNPNALIKAIGCIDKNEELFERTWNGESTPQRQPGL